MKRIINAVIAALMLILLASCTGKANTAVVPAIQFSAPGAEEMISLMAKPCSRSLTACPKSQVTMSSLSIRQTMAIGFIKPATVLCL